MINKKLYRLQHAKENSNTTENRIFYVIISKRSSSNRNTKILVVLQILKQMSYYAKLDRVSNVMLYYINCYHPCTRVKYLKDALRYNNECGPTFISFLYCSSIVAQ